MSEPIVSEPTMPEPTMPEPTMPGLSRLVGDPRLLRHWEGTPFVTTPAHVIDAGYHNKDERVHVDDVALSADFHVHAARTLLA